MSLCPPTVSSNHCIIAMLSCLLLSVYLLLTGPAGCRRSLLTKLLLGDFSHVQTGLLGYLSLHHLSMFWVLMLLCSVFCSLCCLAPSSELWEFRLNIRHLISSYLNVNNWFIEIIKINLLQDSCMKHPLSQDDSESFNVMLFYCLSQRMQTELSWWVSC